MYGDATLRQVAENARRVATTLDGLEANAADVNAADACAGVILWMHTFSPARMRIAGLQALRKPLLDLHTQFNRDLPWGEIDMDFMNLNQAAHSDREFGFIGTRLRTARKTVVGHWEDPVVVARIGAWARAACAWREAHHLRVARFGDNMRHVAVTEGDKVEAQIRLGVSVNGYGLSDLAEAVRSVPDRAVDELVAAYADEFDLAPKLCPEGSRHAELREAARIESGIRGFLMADGYGFGAEGDWKTAVMVRLLKVMASGLPGGTSFMEDYTYDLDPVAPKVLGAHMLEVCPSIAAGRPRCEIHPLSIGSRSDPVRLAFDATTREIGASTHPHPTLSEVLGGAAMAVDGQQINA